MWGGSKYKSQHDIYKDTICTHLFMFGDRMTIYTYLADNDTSPYRLFVLVQCHLVACPHMSEAEVYGSGFNWHTKGV